MYYFTILALCVATFSLTNSYNDGAPGEACATLRPKHGANSSQTSEVPYLIDLSVFDFENNSYVYNPGRMYTLTLAGSEGARFRGFLVQSRMESDQITTVGEFSLTDAGNSRLRPCSTDTDGITHKSNKDKSSVTFGWTAPPVGTGPIQFAYATIERFNTFWADQRSDVLIEGDPVDDDDGDDGDGAAELAMSTLSVLLCLGAVLRF